MLYTRFIAFICVWTLSLVETKNYIENDVTNYFFETYDSNSSSAPDEDSQYVFPGNMTEEEYSNYWSPNQWAKNYRGNEMQVQYDDEHVVLSEGAEVKRTIPYESNIRYGSGERQLLDIYGGDSLPPEAEIYAHIHGGFWHIHSKEYVAHVVKPLYEAGIRVVLPNFDYIPTINMDTLTEEIEEMAEFVFTLAEKYNSRGVAFGGHSTGAQSAAELIFDDYLKKLNENRKRLIKGFVFLSGPYILTTYILLPIKNTLHLTREDVERHSPVLRSNQLNIARNLTAKVLLSIAEFDAPGYRETGKNFHQVLVNNGIEVLFLDVPNEDHFTENEKLFFPDFDLSRAIISILKS